MSKRDKNRSFKDWEDEWGTPDTSKEDAKRVRRNQRLMKSQNKDDWSEDDGDQSHS